MRNCCLLGPTPFFVAYSESLFLGDSLPELIADTLMVSRLDSGRKLIVLAVSLASARIILGWPIVCYYRGLYLFLDDPFLSFSAVFTDVKSIYSY
jgi:hypothetical protein